MQPTHFLDLAPGNLIKQRRTTAENWNRFLNNPRPDLSIRSFIYDSWQRCLNVGVSPLRNQADISLQNDEIQELIQRSQFYEHALPVLNKLTEQTNGTDCLVTLCNNKGCIVFLDGDRDALRHAQTMNFVLGSDWSESAIGTNAIGTSLILDQPVQVFASEHFCEGVHDWVCSSSPIHDPVTQEILGVIDITGTWRRAHTHTFGMIALASQMIDNSLHQQAVQTRYRLLEKYLETTRRYPQNGILLLDAAFHPIEANHAVCELLHLKDEKDLSTVWNSREFHNILLRTHQPTHDGETYEIVIEYLGLKAFVQNVQHSQRRIGCVVILNPLERKARIRHSKPVGSWSAVIGHSPAMQQLVLKCDIAAQTDVPILLLGESGCGKERFARCIHEASPRRAKPFLAINCGAIPKELLAAELFGYEQGTFTGASKNGRKGKFEEAEGGTILLDEIGEMPADFQVFLLRVLQEREIVKLGASHPIPINVRIIAATNRNIAEQVKVGAFRSDLFYRLNVVSVTLPPLRERREDILPIMEDALNKLANTYQISVVDIAESLREFLIQDYSWPGNIRELHNVLEYAVLFCQNHTITWSDVPAYLSAVHDMQDNEGTNASRQTLHPDDPNPSTPCQIATEKAINFDERAMLIELLRQTDGNLSEVGRKLDVARTTVYRRLNKYGLRK